MSNIPLADQVYRLTQTRGMLPVATTTIFREAQDIPIPVAKAEVVPFEPLLPPPPKKLTKHQQMIANANKTKAKEKTPEKKAQDLAKLLARFK